MDLQEVKQMTNNPIPSQHDESSQTGTCKWTNLKGENSGKLCNRAVFDNKTVCTGHIKTATKYGFSLNSDEDKNDIIPKKIKPTQPALQDSFSDDEQYDDDPLSDFENIPQPPTQPVSKDATTIILIKVLNILERITVN